MILHFQIHNLQKQTDEPKHKKASQKQKLARIYDEVETNWIYGV